MVVHWSKCNKLLYNSPFSNFDGLLHRKLRSEVNKNYMSVISMIKSLICDHLEAILSTWTDFGKIQDGRKNWKQLVEIDFLG